MPNRTDRKIKAISSGPERSREPQSPKHGGPRSSSGHLRTVRESQPRQISSLPVLYCRNQNPKTSEFAQSRVERAEHAQNPAPVGRQTVCACICRALSIPTSTQFCPSTVARLAYCAVAPHKFEPQRAFWLPSGVPSRKGRTYAYFLVRLALEQSPPRKEQGTTGDMCDAL